MKNIVCINRFIPVMIFSIILCFAFITDAHAEQSNPFDSWSGRISIQTTGADNKRFGEQFEISQSLLLRLIRNLEINDETDLEIHLLNGLKLSTMDNPFSDMLFSFAPENLRYRCFDMTWEILDESATSMFFSVDRLNARFTLPDADITIGRQAITFGKAWFFNPLDNYLPFDSGTVDRDYKAGVDALRVDIPLGNFSGINIIAVVGARNDFPEMRYPDKGNFTCDYYGSSVLARMFTTINGWDYSVQGGKIYGGYQLGGGIVGDIGDYQIRGEGAYLFASDSKPMFSFDGDLYEDHLQFAVGIGRYYPSGLNLDMEYFHNGAAIPNDLHASLTRLIKGANKHLSRDLIGANATYEFHPLINGQLAVMYSIDDSSFSLQPNLTYSVSNETDFRIGLSMNFGKKPSEESTMTIPQSEFGSYPNVIYAELMYYF